MISIEIGLIVGMWIALSLIVIIDATRQPTLTDHVRCICCDEQVAARDINPGNGMCSTCNADVRVREQRCKHLEHGDLF
jgi:hypothetical protein